MLEQNYLDIICIINNLISPGKKCIVSKELEKVINLALTERYGQNWKGDSDVKKILFKSYETLRNNFNAQIYKDDIPYFYTLYYLPMNVPKIQIVMLQLLARKKLNKDIKILDIGCCVGTATIAIIDLISMLNTLCDLYGIERLFNNVVIDAVDYSEDNLKLYRKNCTSFKSRINKVYDIKDIIINEPQKLDITNDKIKGKYDLVFYSNVLNEISYDTALQAVIDCINNNLYDDSDIIIIEPASRKKALKLNELRLEIEKGTSYRNVLPCGVSEICKKCWNFVTSSIVKCESVQFFDELYNDYFKGKFNEENEQERLKWSYCVLSRTVDKNVSEIFVEGKNISLKTIVLKNQVSNSEYEYKCCDGNGSKAYLNYLNYIPDLFLHGEFIEFNNINLSKVEDKLVIDIDTNSEVIRELNISTLNHKCFIKITEKQIKLFLNRMWGYDGFREGQFEIIKEILEGKSVLGILPTGAGKTICFQLPAMIKAGTSIVVSPLKSLIKDQIDNLHNIGFECTDFIDSSLSKNDKVQIFNKFKSGQIKLLYVAPERLQMFEFQQELEEYCKKTSIDYFIIDEAHCASEWGHDFRPAYLKVIDLAKKLVTPQVVAVTATASPRVREDIIDIFNIPKENVISSYSLDRPEISFQVLNVENNETKKEVLEETILSNIPDILKQESISQVHKTGAGIIFNIYGNSSGKYTYEYGTQYVEEVLKDKNIQVDTYFGAKSDSSKKEIQNKFRKDELSVLAATKGFGMGIDKPNIRYIVHMCYSNSLEGYYQEAGRAGRDRKHAHSVIISRRRDERCINKQQSIGIFAPSCINEWKCSYSNGIKCDYGAQAKFIEGAYGSFEEIKNDLEILYNKIYEHNKNKFYLYICPQQLKEWGLFAEELNKVQQFLFNLKKEGILNDYYVMKYIVSIKEKNQRFNCLKCKRKNCMPIKFGIHFNDSIKKEVGMQKCTKIANNLLDFKMQKYNMLATIWNYTINTDICRRKYLMNYFGQEYENPEGCKFCDIEGIEEFRSVENKGNLVHRKIISQMNELLKVDGYSIEELQGITFEICDKELGDTAKIRALRVLEDYPNRVSALYLSAYLNLLSKSSDSFFRNQFYRLIQKVVDDGIWLEVIKCVLAFEKIDEEMVGEALYGIDKIYENISSVQLLLDSKLSPYIKEIILNRYVIMRLSEK